MINRVIKLVVGILLLVIIGLATFIILKQRTMSDAASHTLITPQPSVTTVVTENDVIFIPAEMERDSKLEAAIINEIDFISAEDIAATRYYFNRIDLDEDGSKEVFVELVGPYTSGSGGDTGLLFRKQEEEYKLLQRFTLISNPIIISNEMTNGWHNIIVKLSGGGAPSQQVQMVFDGSRYPNPSDANPLPPDTVIAGVGIIDNDIAKDFEGGQGLYLTPEVTYKDRKAVEECIRSFFKAFEEGDYAVAGQYCTPETAKRYFSEEAQSNDMISCPLDLVVKKHLPVKFKDMKAYILNNETGANYDISAKMPTVDFYISYTYQDDKGMRQSDGYFVRGVKLEGSWYLDGFATGY